MAQFGRRSLAYIGRPGVVQYRASADSRFMTGSSSPLIFGSWVYFMDPQNAQVKGGTPVHWAISSAPGAVGVHVMDAEVGAISVYLADARAHATPIYRLGGNLFTHGT